MLILYDVAIKATGYTKAELKPELAGVHWLHFMKKLYSHQIALYYNKSLL